MKARELIVRPFTYMHRERGDRARIIALQFRKCFQVAVCRGIFVLAYLQRLKRTKTLRFTPKHEVTNWATTKTLRLGSKFCTDTNAGAKLLIGGFQSRRDVNGIAVGGVIEKPAATKVSDDRRSRVSPNPRNPQLDSFLVAAVAKRLSVFVQS